MTLLDPWIGWRNRLLASPRFQQLAAAFPLTRPIARHRARSLFDLVAGFVYSQVLLACVRLGLLELLREGSLTVDELALKLSLDPAAAQRLLAAASAIALVQQRPGGRYCLGVHGAALLAQPGVQAMIEHHASVYLDLADPVALLRQPAAGRTELSRFWAYADATLSETPAPERVADYSALMSASQPLVAHEILRAYPLRKHRCLMDVGGGEGSFLMAAAATAPQLSLMLFDLPAVAERGRHALAAAGLATRARICPGDFTSDRLPTGADVISLVRVLHDHDDPAALALLESARAALPPGGSLLVAEPMAGTPGAAAMGDAYFGFYLLAMGQGRPRSETQIRSLLGAAGFGRVRRLRTALPLQTSLLRATAP